MSPNGVRGLLGLALAATLLAAYFAPSPADDGVQLVQNKQVRMDRPKAVIADMQAHRGGNERAVEVLSIRSRDADEFADVADAVFASTRWATPVETTVPRPVPAVQAEPAAAPQAPPLPFRVLGRYVEDGQVAVFLQHNDQNLVARVGDTLAEHYKVESLQGGTLTLLYTPLNQKQTLDVGDSESREAR